MLGRFWGPFSPPPPVPMLPNWRDGLGNRAQTGQWRAWDMGHCWELGVGAPPPPPSSGRSILGGPDESLGPARATGQLIKTSPSPQSSAWPGNCLLPPFSNLSIPFVPRRVCSLPCFLEHILYCRCRWPTPHALQRLSLLFNRETACDAHHAHCTSPSSPSTGACVDCSFG